VHIGNLSSHRSIGSAQDALAGVEARESVRFSPCLPGIATGKNTVPGTAHVSRSSHSNFSQLEKSLSSFEGSKRSRRPKKAYYENACNLPNWKCERLERACAFRDKVITKQAHQIKKFNKLNQTNSILIASPSENPPQTIKGDHIGDSQIDTFAGETKVRSQAVKPLSTPASANSDSRSMPHRRIKFCPSSTMKYSFGRKLMRRKKSFSRQLLSNYTRRQNESFRAILREYSRQILRRGVGSWMSVEEYLVHLKPLASCCKGGELLLNTVIRKAFAEFYSQNDSDSHQSSLRDLDGLKNHDFVYENLLSASDGMVEALVSKLNSTQEHYNETMLNLQQKNSELDADLARVSKTFNEEKSLHDELIQEDKERQRQLEVLSQVMFGSRREEVTTALINEIELLSNGKPIFLRLKEQAMSENLNSKRRDLSMYQDSGKQYDNSNPIIPRSTLSGFKSGACSRCLSKPNELQWMNAKHASTGGQGNNVDNTQHRKSPNMKTSKAEVAFSSSSRLLVKELLTSLLDHRIIQSRRSLKLKNLLAKMNATLLKFKEISGTICNELTACAAKFAFLKDSSQTAGQVELTQQQRSDRALFEILARILDLLQHRYIFKVQKLTSVGFNLIGQVCLEDEGVKDKISCWINSRGNRAMTIQKSNEQAEESYPMSTVSSTTGAFTSKADVHYAASGAQIFHFERPWLMLGLI
jgi:hypothetical protein